VIQPVMTSTDRWQRPAAFVQPSNQIKSIYSLTAARKKEKEIPLLKEWKVRNKQN